MVLSGPGFFFWDGSLGMFTLALLCLACYSSAQFAFVRLWLDLLD